MVTGIKRIECVQNVEYRPGLKSTGVNYYERPLKFLSERSDSVRATLGGHVQRNLEVRNFLSDIQTSIHAMGLAGCKCANKI